MKCTVCSAHIPTTCAQIPATQAELKDLKTNHGKAVLGSTTVEMAIGGMRGIPGLLWETSLLDPEEGIRFRGYSIPECQEKLPAAAPGGEPLPEAMFWLLLTGDIPTKQQVDGLTAELKVQQGCMEKQAQACSTISVLCMHEAFEQTAENHTQIQARSKLPDNVIKVLRAMPADTHPMTQLCAAVLTLQPASKFAAAYQAGIHKSKYWEPFYEDTLDLVAKLPEVCVDAANETCVDALPQRAYTNKQSEIPSHAHSITGGGHHLPQHLPQRRAHCARLVAGLGGQPVAHAGL